MSIGCRKNTELFCKTFLGMILFLFIQQLNGQGNDDITFDDKSFKAGIHASPTGIGLFFRNTIPGKKKTSHVFDICFTGVRNVREKSIQNLRMINTSPYVFGKINRFYVLRPMYGIQMAMAERHSKNSVGINVFACAGPNIGFLKPVYVDVETVDPNSPSSFTTVSMRYNPFTIDQNRINGYSSFDKGIGETKLVTGLSMKLGADFNWGYYSSDFRSLEIGMQMDVFPSRPEIMYGIKNKILYSSFYISFALGKNY